MPIDQITFQNSGYFSGLMIDYLNQEPKLASLYNRFPTLENFNIQIQEKKNNFPLGNRLILAQALQEQYQDVQASQASLDNIDLLKKATTFTITTGHQLNLFTGPLYFLYKIISVINCCSTLKKQYPEHDFVPVYWMATEDHDFEEINHFTYQQKVIYWDKESSGPVGRLSTQGLEKVYNIFEKHIGASDNAQELKDLFKNAYLKHNNLSQATLYLANELFKDKGLVIIDADTKALKQLFAPHIKEELLNQSAIVQVQQSFKILKDYNIQVTPREINLFYILDNLRERIIWDQGHFRINNTDLKFTQEQILDELKQHPQRFSPNVILRPLYQEVILPNLCYIGGGGELAYWLELKKVFELHKVTFPMLLMRNSVLLVDEKQEQKRIKLNLTYKDLFKPSSQLIKDKTREFSKITIDFEQQRKVLVQQFEDLEKVTLLTNKSFIGAVSAQKKKQLKGLDALEKRFWRAETKNNQDKLNRIKHLQDQLFPNNSLQERNENFAAFYEHYGMTLLDKLYKELNPLEHNFDIII